MSFLRSSLLALVMTTAAACALAQDGTIHPLAAPAEPRAIPLGTGGVDNQPASESWFRQWGQPMARNITRATLTPFLPAPGMGNGAAVLVAPGGGFRWLALNHEGWAVAQSLADKGIAAFVLKYRLQPTPESLDGFKDSMNRMFAAAGSGDGNPRALLPDLANQLADAEAAYALIHARAREWGVDTRRLGMIGFSAGAGLTMHSTLNSKTMKLAFIGPIYGGMGPVAVPQDAPPMFNVIAADDFLFRGQFGVVKAWHDAGRPVEFHLFQNGGHGFGLGYPGKTAQGWFPLFLNWLDVNGFLKGKPAP
jgi:acetyl esterase/lipase